MGLRREKREFGVWFLFGLVLYLNERGEDRTLHLGSKLEGNKAQEKVSHLFDHLRV